MGHLSARVVKMLWPLTFFLLFSAGPAFAQPFEAIIKDVQGDVEVRFPDRLDWERAYVGMKLKEGTEVMTGPFSNATLTFADRSISTIDSFSVITIDRLRQTQDVTVTHLNLRAGAIIGTNVDSDETRPVDFKVKTPTLVASVRGTDIALIQAFVKGISDVMMGEKGLMDVYNDMIGYSTSVGSGDQTNTQLDPSYALVLAEKILQHIIGGQTDDEKVVAAEIAVQAGLDPVDLALGNIPEPSELARQLGDSSLALGPSALFSDNFSAGLGNWDWLNAITTDAFGSIVGPDGPFAVVHTGGEGQSQGLLFKQFDLSEPQELNVSLTHNFFSEEYPDIDPKFDDFYVIELHTPDTGTALGAGHVIAEGKVTTSTFTPVSHAGLPSFIDQGGTHAGQTGWTTVDQTVSAPAGTSELHIHVRDELDVGFDSAVLVDDVTVQ